MELFCIIILTVCLWPGSKHHFHPLISGFHFWIAPATEKQIYIYIYIYITILPQDSHHLLQSPVLLPKSNIVRKNIKSPINIYKATSSAAAVIVCVMGVWGSKTFSQDTIFPMACTYAMSFFLKNSFLLEAFNKTLCTISTVKF